MTNTISDTLYLHEYKRQQQLQRNNDLGKDAFLKILITQLQNQDPTSPMEDKEFIAQMAQFTTLEQMTNLNTQFTKFFQSHMQSQFFSNTQLIGKTVEWDDWVEDESGNLSSVNMKGTVTAVKFKDGNVEIIVDDEYTISTNDVKVVRLKEDNEE